jgi:hypothetical protein
MTYDIAHQALIKRKKSEFTQNRNQSSFSIMEGVYKLTLTITDGILSSNPKTSNQKNILVKFVEGLVRFILEHNPNGELNLTEYTTCKLILDDRNVMLHATSKYRLDGHWYDWCLVGWQGFDETYPACLLGFFECNLPGVEQNYRETTVYVVLQSSQGYFPISMDMMSEQCVSKFHTSEDVDECTYFVPIKSIVHLLNVFQNFGGPNREYFCTLPQREWVCYFGNKIRQHH